MSLDDELIVHAEVMEVDVQVEIADVTLEVDDPDVVVVLAGNVGPPGQQGEQGEPGTPGSSQAFQYVHSQGLAATTWNIAHNLNGFPNVTVVDSAGTNIEGELIYDDSNNITLNFSAAFGGTAYLS